MNNKYREILDQIVEETNDAIGHCREVAKKVQADVQPKPRYKSVIRNENTSSPNPTTGTSDANYNSSIQTDRRTLQRKAATNDLYSRIGQEITSTPRNGGLMPLPNIDLKLNPKSYQHSSIMEEYQESFTDLKVHREDSLLKKSNTVEQQLHGNDPIYYDFITNSSIGMFDNQHIN